LDTEQNLIALIDYHSLQRALLYNTCGDGMYQVFKNKWVSPPKPVHEDYSGFNIIVTGATSGIGEEAAYKFAALGASKVIITAREGGIN
jgi:NADPH:quinone reductase-like Zn-dependent oxidoreductase